MQMGTFMKANGKTINPMDSENTAIQMESYMKETGRMINRTVEAYKYGPMAKDMKVIFKRDSNLEKVSSSLMTVLIMRETSRTTKFTEKVKL